MLTKASKESNTAFECIICLEPINVQDACECLECEVAICAKCCQQLERQKQTCPQCRSEEGFKKKLSRDHKEKIENLQFVCPSCGITLNYKDAKKHISD